MFALMRCYALFLLRGDLEEHNKEVHKAYLDFQANNKIINIDDLKGPHHEKQTF